uniref:Uncharacterized protein n=2 Tax=unclassified Caudoviricetes TaxID=2788787 RepID=A0A8S5PVD6_9CAUD|nr:MAG TPA: hypothetical protein [Siphoviridae sp. ctPxx43]DAE10252.1 MAG TPA: hypothetical protein [Siphoviridae sp. ct0yh16]
MPPVSYSFHDIRVKTSYISFISQKMYFYKRATMCYSSLKEIFYIRRN